MGLFGSKKKKQDDTETREATARELGLLFDVVDAIRIDPVDFFLIPGGRPYGASNVLYGHVGPTEVRIFDWSAQRPSDPMPELAGFAGLGGATIKMTAALVGLPHGVPTLLLTRGCTATTRGLPQLATGNAELDSRFVCHTRRPEVACKLDEPDFVAALINCPDDVSVEFTDQSLLVVGQRRPAEQLTLFTRGAIALAAATPSALFAP
jgi:hypothetical protein